MKMLRNISRRASCLIAAASLLALLPGSLSAATTPGSLPAANTPGSLPADTEFHPAITAGPVYGYNATFKHHGGLSLKAEFPVNRHFEAEAKAEYLSPKVAGIGVVARPLFPLGPGELFLDASALCRFYNIYSTADLAFAASVGYRMNYVNVQIGMMSHSILDMNRSEKTSDTDIHEPFNLLYRLEVSVRPRTSRWNVSAAGANFTDFEYERTWVPIYSLGGRYDLRGNLRLLLRAYLKPSGVFHLNAQFWEFSLRAGVKYTF